MKARLAWLVARTLGVVYAGVLLPTGIPTHASAACLRCNASCGPQTCSYSCDPAAKGKDGYTACTPSETGCTDLGKDCVAS
jgi:hypothetical protein